MGKMQSQRWLLAVLISALCCAGVGPKAAAQAKPSAGKATPKNKDAQKKRSAPRSGALPPLPATTVVPLTPATRAVQPDDTLLYAGQAPELAKLTLSPWGSGSVEDNTQASVTNGGHSLKVTTLDSYQGAKIGFQTPQGLGSLTDPTRFIIFTLRLTADTRFQSTRLPAERTQSPGPPRMVLAQYSQQPRPPGMPLPPGMSPPGMPPPGMPFPGPGSNAPQPAPPVPPQQLTFVHITFTLASGAQADVLRPFPDLSQTDAGAGSEQWVDVGVPLAALHFAAGAASSPLQSITLGGNNYAVFYVGQIKITQDQTPITCFAGDTLTAAPGEPVTLHGTAGGGASALKYSWDFDASDGITEQAVGQTVTTVYYKPQDYKATLTVSDIDGLKKPATSTVTIHVQQ